LNTADLRLNAKVLFMHTGGLPSVHAYEDVVLGRTALND
jgi:D-cysteine desulfhydrase